MSVSLSTSPLASHPSFQSLAITRVIPLVRRHGMELVGWIIFNMITLGSGWLLSHWMPLSVLSWTHRMVSVDEAQELAVDTEDGGEIVKVQKMGKRKGAIFRHLRLMVNENLGTIEALNPLEKIEKKELTKRAEEGWKQEIAKELEEVYGNNLLDVKVPSWSNILMNEVLRPFFVFQIYSVGLWIAEEYYYFSFCILIIAIVSIYSTVLETQESLQRIAEMSHFETEVVALRDGVRCMIMSSQLVIGDIIFLKDEMVVPADIVLLEGAAVMNEAMLTGESTPVCKDALKMHSKVEEIALSTELQSVVFGASRVLQLKPEVSNGDVKGIVIRTGFLTTKGSLILSILFPKPSFFQFERQSYIFVLILFCISLLGFCVCAWRMTTFGYANHEILLRGLDLITITVPPTLPLSLTIGTNFALICLRAKKIFCISPGRINMAGKVKLFCFDKTGTLTTQGLEILGVVPVCDGIFGQLISSVDAVPENVLFCMSACQSLATLTKGKDLHLIGDPLELEIFRFTNSILEDTPGKFSLCRVSSFSFASEILIHRKNDFASELRRMSVLASVNGCIYSFVKGSPESLKALCVKCSLPANFDEVLAQDARAGYRVIALACKKMDISPDMFVHISRMDMESNLQFLGFVVMENKLKPESAPTIGHLKEAGIRCVMVTGDNPLTSITVARQSGMIHDPTLVFISTMVDNKVEWICSTEDAQRLDSATLRPLKFDNFSHPYELTMTGEAFERLYEQHLFELDKNLVERHPQVEILLVEQDANIVQSRSEFLDKLDYRDAEMCQYLENSTLHKAMVATQIFARCSPMQKALIVQEFQKLGLYVGMVGDGANDCVALKTAHVGVSLSEADASIAAPFTSLQPNIECIPLLLLEGRSSLVTCFQVFRFMAIYSIIQFSFTVLSFFAHSAPGSWQFLYQDLVIVFPLTIFIGVMTSSQVLTTKRPSGNLLSFRNVCATFGQSLICFCFQLIAFFACRGDSAYTSSSSSLNIMTWETTSIYFLSSAQYIIAAAILSFGSPWKESPFKNYRFLCWIACVTFLTLFLILLPKTFIFFTQDDVDLSVAWRWKLFGLVVGNAVLSTLFEFFVIPSLCRLLSRGHEIKSVFGRGSAKFAWHPKPFHKLRV